MQLVATVTIFFALAIAVFGREISDNSLTRIVGGSIAPNGKYPYTVSLRVYFKHFCGGAILNNRWIVTAAHCLAGKEAHQISVIAGTNLLAEAGQMYQAVIIKSHPDYNSKTFKNNIGLIHVTREIVFTGKIQPIPLPINNSDKSGLRAILTGWGSTSVTGALSNRLQQIELTVIDQKVCASKQDKVTASNICTFTKVGEGACLGDGGSPLAADDILIGLVSFSNPCAKGDPDVFTRVWSFVDWIHNTMDQNKWPGKNHSFE